MVENKKNPFHKTIGDFFDSLKIPGAEVRKDTACRRDCVEIDIDMIKDKEEAEKKRRSLPLFLSANKSWPNKFTEVDILMLYRGKVKVIVEIEESNVKPINILGKFLASALSEYYIYLDEDPVSFDDSVLFIQILDSSRIIEDKSKKPEQWDIIEQTINRIIPVAGSKINRYKIFYGEPKEFREEGKMREGLITHITDYIGQ